MAEITGTAGADNLNGTTGNDRIYGGGDDDVIAGGDGSDELHGEDGDDTLSGGNSLDILTGGEGNDRIDGGAGNDAVRADPGDDVIEGGLGTDSITFYDTDHGVTVDLGQGIAIGEGTDTLSGLERAYGSDHDDVLTGDQWGNELRGGLGSDTLNGGAGSDWLYGGDGDAAWLEGGDFAVDRLDGGDGGDALVIGENDHAEGGAGVDALFLYLHAPTTVDLSALWSGGTGYNGTGLLTGIERIQRIEGSSGADIIILGTGGVDPDVGAYWPHADGADGDDRITGGDGGEWLMGGGGDDVLLGLGGDDHLSGNAGYDRLEGGDGDDTLDLSGDGDVLIGGPGSDTYVVSAYWDPLPAISIFEEEGEAGQDRISIHGDWASPTGDGIFADLRTIEVAELISEHDLAGPEFVLGALFQETGIRSLVVLADVDASQVTVGLDIELMPNDYRDATGGVISFAVTGGSGDDVFRVNRYFLPPSDRHFSLDGGPGTDRLSLPTSEVAISLFDGPLTVNFGLVLTNIEVIELGTPAAPDDGDHGEYYSLKLTDALFAAGERLTIDASALRARRYGADQLRLDAGGLTGGRALEVLGGQGGDWVTAGAGADALYGGDGMDTLEGGDGDDRLDGGAGTDNLRGQSGDDLYLVDSGGDAVRESADGGADTVHAAISYWLPQHVENLVLTGSASLGGWGNHFANSLTGNSGGNRLDGGGGADRMAGGEGDDVYVVDDANDAVIEAGNQGTDTVESGVSHVLPEQVENLLLTGIAANGTGNGLANILTGNSASNVLNGSAGDDTMKGGGGNDLYVVDVAADLVVELAGGGVDTVRSSVSYALADHVENLVLTGGGSNQATGNGLANSLTGNNGNNRLDGAAGADTMAGGAGHDVYVVNQAGDQVIEAGSSGNDTVESAVSYTLPIHVEKLILTGGFGYDGRGNAGANTIIGNSGWNLVSGGSGNDVIDGGGGLDRVIGGAGQDSLKGGAGADRFYFNMAPGAANADRILDFATGEDSLWLIVSLFGRAGPSGVLAETAFHAGAAAADADDRILYDAATGRLFYDPDGAGAAAASLFATLAPGTALSHADIHLYG